MGKGARSSSSNVSEATPVLTNGHKSSSEEISTQDPAQLSGLEEWKAFEQVTKNMMKNREAYAKWDDVLEDYAIQKEKAESFAAEIDDLKKHRTMMLADFAEKYKEWLEEKEELILQAKTEDEKKGSAHSEEVTALNKEIASLKDELETAHKDKQALQKKHDDTRRHCIETKDEVEMWRKKTERYEQNFATLDDTALETQ
jgi:chromosome segregation ATPase